MKNNKLEVFKSHLIRLIKEETEGGEEEQKGAEKVLYDTILSPSDINATIEALADIKNYGIYAQNLRDPKVILRVFGPPVPATKGRVAKETWDQSNESEKLSKIIDIKSRAPQEWVKVGEKLESKFDEWSIENDNTSFPEFLVTLEAKDLPMEFFGKYASTYFATKTPDNLKKYSGVMNKDDQFIVSGDKVIFPVKKNPFQTKDYLEKVLKTIMGNAKIPYTLSQQESDDQPKVVSNVQGVVDKINFVKTFDTPKLASKFKKLIPKDFAEKITVDMGKVMVSDITDPQKKNLMATALKFIADNKPKKEPTEDAIKESLSKLVKKILAEKKFPDLTGDGKVTRADILKGRGVVLEKEGVPHYTKDGKEWKGKVHKMPDNSLMSGNPHDKDGSGSNGKSEKLYHKEDLNKTNKTKNSTMNESFKNQLKKAIKEVLQETKLKTEGINYDSLKKISTADLKSLMDVKKKEANKLKADTNAPPMIQGAIKKLGVEMGKIERELNSRK